MSKKQALVVIVLAGAVLTFKTVRGQVGVLDDGPPAFLVVSDQANYDTMAAILNGYTGVPNDRLMFYSAVNSSPNSVITGWQGVVTNVQANGTGNLVTVQVLPTLATADLGPATVILSSDYSEQYQINTNGTFQYMGFLDPQQQFGLPPEEMVGL